MRQQSVNHFFVDPACLLPLHQQLKEQIRLAYSSGTLSPSDPLPSIRALARQTGVGEAIVRRAYRELSASGLLTTQPRRGVVLNPALVFRGETEVLIAEATREAERILRWSQQRGLNPISFARLISCRVWAQQLSSPTCVMVHACDELAARSAGQVAMAWDVKVAALSLSAFSRLTDEAVRAYTTILVSSHLYKDVLRIGTVHADRLFPVKDQMARSFIRRVRRLAPGSSVLVVFSEEYFERAGRSTLRHCEKVVGGSYQFEIRPFRNPTDFAAEAASGKYQLIVLNPPVWTQVPPRVRRLPRIVSVFSELDMQSLEQIRIAAGVVL